MKLIFLSAAFLFATITASAQTKKPLVTKPVTANDWLLWYKGKRKSDSVLITNQGWEITYKRKQNIVQAKQPPSSTAFKKMEMQLSPAKAKTGTAQIIQLYAGNTRIDPAQLPTIKLGLEAIDDVDLLYKKALTTKIDLPKQEDNYLTASDGKGKGPMPWNDEQPRWESLYETIKADAAALPDVETMTLPNPPEMDLSLCFYCDTVAKKQMEQRRDDYIKNLFTAETALMQNSMSLSRILNLAADANKASFSPEMAKANEQVSVNYIPLAAYRIERKLIRLIKANRGNLQKMMSLLPIAIQLSRFNQLMGYEETLEAQFTNMITVPEVEAFVQKKMDELDYNTTLNITWIFAIERQFQLLTGESFMATPTFQKMLDFNNFNLTVSMDAKYAEDGTTTIGQMKTNVHPYKALPTRDCKYLFLQSRGKQLLGIGQPLLNYSLLRAEHHEPDNNFRYAGTKKFVSIDPLIKLSFCGEEDTLKLFPITPNLQDMQETWDGPTGKEHIGYVTDLLNEAFDNNGNTVEGDDEMLEKLMATQQATAKLGTAEEVVDNIPYLDKGFGIVAQIKEQFGLNALTLVPLTTTNKSAVLFDHLHNGKLFNDAQGIEYANMWIKLEHVK